MAPARQLAALLRALSEHPAGSAAGRVLRSTCPNPAAAPAESSQAATQDKAE